MTSVGQADSLPATVRPEPVEGRASTGFDRLSLNGARGAPAGSVTPPDAAAGAAVCAALRGQVEKLGLSIGSEPVWEAAAFEEAVDPFSREVSVVATWRGGERFGKATFFPDGRIFAEYQVLQPNPADEASYVDSVQVWGRPDKLRGEAVIAEYLK